MTITYREFKFNDIIFAITPKEKNRGEKYPTIIYKDTGKQVGNQKGLMRELGLSVVKTSKPNTHRYIEELHRILEENNITIITKNTADLVKFEKEKFKEKTVADI